MSRRRRPARELPAESDDSWRPAQRPSRLPAWVPRPLRITLRVLTKLAIWGIIIFLLVATFYLCLSFRYDLTSVTAMPERSIILDTKNRELATLHGENRRLISRDEIPAEFVLALLAREACYKQGEVVTLEQVINDKTPLEFDRTGLKA